MRREPVGAREILEASERAASELDLRLGLGDDDGSRIR